MGWRCVPKQSCPTHSRNSATAFLLGQSGILAISCFHGLWESLVSSSCLYTLCNTCFGCSLIEYREYISTVILYIYHQVTLRLHVSTVNGHLQANKEHIKVQQSSTQWDAISYNTYNQVTLLLHVSTVNGHLQVSFILGINFCFVVRRISLCTSFTCGISSPELL